jgi:hypothetical protein
VLTFNQPIADRNHRWKEPHSREQPKERSRRSKTTIEKELSPDGRTAREESAMALSSRTPMSYVPKIDEYARLQAENEAEAARLERERAMRQKRHRAAGVQAEMNAQAGHFKRNFQVLTGGRANAAKQQSSRDDKAQRMADQAQRLADYYGFYYGQY